MIKVFLAGEGPNELGGWSNERIYRDERPLLGVLESLARQVVPTGWDVHDAMVWKDIPKLAIGTRGQGLERKTVLAARLHAKESGCDVVLFSRDRDGPKKDTGSARYHPMLDPCARGSIAFEQRSRPHPARESDSASPGAYLRTKLSAAPAASRRPCRAAWPPGRAPRRAPRRRSAAGSPPARPDTAPATGTPRTQARGAAP